MPHFELLYPSEFLKASDLLGKEVAVTIQQVEQEVLKGTDGRSKKKVTIRFVGKEKRLVLNITNARAIAKLHGNITEEWEGKQVRLYPTSCEAFGETKECIRIK